ncbi:MAG TPA: phosphoribosylanthranilate isomerase [Thermoanaerobaculia bacterium]|nr:phosphoribosylanthranilate isomerase [Thermoanaerobaculia bacterium]
MTAVKICGLTRARDVVLAGALGATYAGFNFSAASPRRVSPEEARVLAAAVRPGMLKVGVFVGEDADTIAAAVRAAGLDLVQLHRRLTEEDVAASPVPVIAVARPSAAGGFAVPRREILVRCHAVLFDPSEGSGAAIDPARVEEASWPVPVLVAGGLTPETVGDVIRRLRPAGVDVASGVEESPGIKDAEKLRRFFAAVREADAQAG